MLTNYFNQQFLPISTFLLSWKLILAFPLTSVAAICTMTASIV